MDRRAPYATRVVTSREALDAIADDWIRCWTALPRAQVYQHPEMLRYDYRDQHGASPVSAMVLERGGDVVGIVPFVVVPYTVTWKVRLPRTNRTILRFPMTAVEVPAEDLMAPDDHAAREALIDGLFAAYRGIDVIRFPYSGVDLKALAAGVRKGARRRVWAPERPTPVLTIQLADDVPTYLKTLTKKVRDNVRRERKILAALDGTPLRLDVVTEPDDVPAFLDRADQVFAGSWHAERGANKIRKSRATDERLSYQAAHGWLRCYVLSKGEEPIAFIQGLQSGRMFRALKTAYSATWSKYSPGKVMWFLVLEDLYESGAFDELNFGYGDWQYKRVMATDGYTVRTQEAIRPGIRTALAWSGPVAYSFVRRAAIAGLQRLELDGRLARWSRKHLAR